MTGRTGDISHRAADHEQRDSGDRRRFRRSYLLGNAFEAWAALAAIMTGLVFLVEPDALVNSVIAETAGPLAFVWGLMYALGGLTTLYGLWKPRPHLELAGLSLFASSALIDGVALLVERGPAGIRVALIYLSLTCASVMRAYLVLKLARIATAGDPGG